jgi:hypothetical protein
MDVLFEVLKNAAVSFVFAGYDFWASAFCLVDTLVTLARSDEGEASGQTSD